MTIKKQVVAVTKTEWRHSPNLDSLKMIEATIRKNNGVLGKTQVWESLPRKMMYQTYKRALDYFIERKSVVIVSGKVQWIDYPDTLSILMKKTVPAPSSNKHS